MESISASTIYLRSNANTSNKWKFDEMNMSANSHEKMTNIVFLRIPKTGSSTLRHILFKFAWKNDLRLAIYKNYHFDHPVTDLFPPFRVGITPMFNIMADHGVFKPMLISKILHTPMTNITFVRHPVLWLDSFLRYSELSNPHRFNLDAPITSFLKIVKSSNSTELNYINGAILKYFDMYTSLKTEREEYSRIDETFIVGITDYYDESLVLLRRALGWSMKDIIHMPKNVQNYKKRAPIKDLLYSQVCKVMPRQCLLYEHLNQTFWERFNKEQNDILGEVYHFKKTLKNIELFCRKMPTFYWRFNASRSYLPTNLSESIKIGASQWNRPFHFTYRDCVNEQVTFYESLFFYRQNRNENCSEPVPTVCLQPVCGFSCTQTKLGLDPINSAIQN